MLNRTNRTQSANTNRLDLGTRKLGLQAGGNNGSLTLRTAHSFPTVVVRTGVEEYPRIPVEAPPIAAMPKPMKPAMSAMPGSSPRPASPSRGFQAWDQGQSAMSSQPAPTVAVLGDVAGTSRIDAPQVTPSQGHPRSSLGWHCDRTRRAGRSARAALALVTGAAPIS
jgi:hypothetical protein